MNKDQLLARAQELQIEVPEKATNAQLEDLIKIAEHPLLAQAVKDLDAKAKDLADQLVAVVAEKMELLEQVEAQPKAAEINTDRTFKKGKDTYAFGIASFRFKGDKYTAEEAVQDEDLMEEIIKSGFIHLKKL